MNYNGYVIAFLNIFIFFLILQTVFNEGEWSSCSPLFRPHKPSEKPWILCRWSWSLPQNIWQADDTRGKPFTNLFLLFLSLPFIANSYGPFSFSLCSQIKKKERMKVLWTIFCCLLLEWKPAVFEEALSAIFGKLSMPQPLYPLQSIFL